MYIGPYWPLLIPMGVSVHVFPNHYCLLKMTGGHLGWKASHDLVQHTVSTSVGCDMEECQRKLHTETEALLLLFIRIQFCGILEFEQTVSANTAQGRTTCMRYNLHVPFRM